MKNLPNQTVCNYAVLRFLPYPETGEFVNLGIIVYCPENGFFDAKLGDNFRRVMDFFPKLDGVCFRATLDAIFKELERVRTLISQTGDREQGRRVFRETVRQRESIFHFGETRTIFTPDPTTLTENLYRQYVARY